jgi:hypothetical protein
MADLFRERHWTKYLPDGFVMQVYLKTAHGRIVTFSVALIKNGECVTRYDNAGEPPGFRTLLILAQRTETQLINNQAKEK